MALELTTTRRRMPLSETTFVTRVPPYVQTYLGQHDYGPRGHRAREMAGFGSLDSQVSTAELQRLLRIAGHCSAGVIDNLWGPNTQGALREFINAVSAQGGQQYSDADYAADRRSNTVRLDSGLLIKLRRAAAGAQDECPMQPSGGGGGGMRPGGELPPPPANGGGGYTTAGMMGSPMLWLGLAAAVGVAYWAYYQSSDDDMMMTPPRL